MRPYVALIHLPENGSSWGVTFPDVPGCVSAGDSFEEAVENAREALSGHLAALQADGDPIPEARTYKQVRDDEDVQAEVREGATLHLVEPRVIAAERVRVNITIDKGLLRRADETAEAKGITRSAFIEQALDRLIEVS